ncbi:hypothetical protein BDR26DRAFT_867328 [Obelidium mucronatum]|nr:hypothetical protein BDR26DRAFT_867328 [Obelidium mucronatum]
MALTFQSWIALGFFGASVFFCIHPVDVFVPVPKRGGQSHWRLPLNLATAPPAVILVLLCSTVVKPSDIQRGILGDEKGLIIPYSILILVFSLAILCISIDETGLFRNIAYTATIRSSNSKKLFGNLFLLSAVLTVLTSNDVVVLTVTPILLYFAEAAKSYFLLKINPVPFLMSGFWVCNVASMGLYIGNPTNVIVAQANNINDIPEQLNPPNLNIEEYRVTDIFGAWFGSISLGLCLLLLMTVPMVVENLPVWVITLPFAGIVLLKEVIMDLLISGQSATTMPSSPAAERLDMGFIQADSTFPDSATDDPTCGNHMNSQDILIIGDIDDIEHESQKTSFLTNSMVILKTRLPKTITIASRLPWALIPFTLGMFILVESLTSLNWTSLLATTLSKVSASHTSTIFAIATITTLACNVLNNLPMTILFTRALLHPNYIQGILENISQNDSSIDADESLKRAQEIRKNALYGLVVGSNLGANLLFIGSLAGIMWIGLVNKPPPNHGRRRTGEGSSAHILISQVQFLKLCLCVTPFVLVVCCGCLAGEQALGFFL